MVLVGSMLSLVAAGVAISWMKLAHSRFSLAGLPVSSIIVSVCVFTILFLMIRRIMTLNALLRIPMHYMVEGDLTIDQNAERVDLVAEEQDRIQAAR
jgi:type IV secretory pathway VirB3-like protein